MKLLEQNWQEQMEQYPEWSTYIGLSDYNHLWTDISVKGYEERASWYQEWLKKIQNIDRSKLSQESRLNYDLLIHDLRDSVEKQRFPFQLLAMDQLGGIQFSAIRLFNISPKASLKDYQNLLNRFKGLAKQVDDTRLLLAKGVAQKVMHPKIVMEKVPEQIEPLLVPNPDENPLMKTFAEIDKKLPQKDANSIRNEAKKLLLEQIIPAYQNLQKFLEEKYIPAASSKVGISNIKNGREWYAYLAKHHTTTNSTPKEIHHLGLSEVQRIDREMQKVQVNLGHKGSLQSFHQFMRENDKFYYKEAGQLVQGYRDIGKRADAELLKLFGKLPRLPYGIRPMPMPQAKTAPTAYYYQGSPEAARPGFFEVNSYNLKSRPIWEMEVLALHEAVPGHHLQIALAQENQNIPEFRKHGSHTAFVEGWALYAESLGKEIGFYTTPESDYGRLTYEMWRAIRLVVDTGMHVMGWSREKAIQFFKDHLGKPEHDIISEVDRYISWPGQALAYKMGQLKILELRKMAETQLGSAFDIRAFHDTVLGSGSVTLNILEVRIKDWIMAQKKQLDRAG